MASPTLRTEWRGPGSGAVALLLSELLRGSFEAHAQRRKVNSPQVRAGLSAPASTFPSATRARAAEAPPRGSPSPAMPSPHVRVCEEEELRLFSFLHPRLQSDSSHSDTQCLLATHPRRLCVYDKLNRVKPTAGQTGSAASIKKHVPLKIKPLVQPRDQSRRVHDSIQLQKCKPSLSSDPRGSHGSDSSSDLASHLP